MSGITIGWDETAPADSRNAGLGAGDIRSIRTNLRGALNAEHIFPSTGGLAGGHRPGSALVYYGPLSAVSSGDTEGRLMLTSDTTELYHIGSANTQKLLPNLGQVIHGTSANTYPVRQLVQSGFTEGSLWSAGGVTITFPSAYSAAPVVTTTVDVPGSEPTETQTYLPVLGSVTATNMRVGVLILTANSVDPATLNFAGLSVRLNWVSIGTVGA